MRCSGEKGATPPDTVEGTPFLSAKEIPKDNPARTAWDGIPVTTTRLPSGGLRYWFACPACGRRVERIYCLGHYPKCRRCHRLTYRSQHVYLSRHPVLRSLQLVARLDALEARYKAGDPSALKPLRKLVDRMWKELPRDKTNEP